MTTWNTRLRSARIKNKISQQEMANRMGKISRTSIAQWETHATLECEAGNFLRACTVLNVDPYYTMFGVKFTENINDIRNIR